MAGLRRRRRGDPGAEAPPRGGDPRPQLPDAGNLQLRRRLRRRQPRPGAPGGEGRRARHRHGGREVHGRDRQIAQSRQDGANPRPRGRLLTRRFDRRRGRARAAAPLSRRPGRRLCQHHGGGEGGSGHLLHLRQRAQGHRIVGRAPRRHAARQVPRGERRRRNEGRDHPLGWALRRARAVHRRRRQAGARGPSRRRRARPSRMSARGRRRSGLLRLDRGDVDLCRRAQARAGGAAHRMLDERQRLGQPPRGRVRPPLQPVPPHETHHPRQDPQIARGKPVRGDRRPCWRRAGSPPRSAPTTARSCTRSTRSPPATGFAFPRSSTVSPAPRRRRSNGSRASASPSIARPTAVSRSASRRRIAAGASSTPAATAPGAS